MTLDRTIPQHVPADLVVDFNVYLPMRGDENFHDPYRRLQEQGVSEIFWSPYNGGHWVFARQDVLYEGFADYKRFPSDYQVVPKHEGPPPELRQLPVLVNPPEHTGYRALFSSAFTLPAIKAREEEVRALARALSEEIAPKRYCDFVHDFAQRLPIKVFMGMVDLPEEDRLMLIELTDGVFRPSDGDRNAVFAKMAAYLGKVIDERVVRPGTDLISKIATSMIEGKQVSRQDAIGVLSVLLVAGLDTVASMSAFTMHFLACNPVHRRRLIEDPSLIPAATDEFLRRFALLSPGRVVADDIVYRGVAMKKGDMVVLATPFGAVDPSAYETPADVKFDRKSPKSTTFGNGPHRCPGNMLARSEIRIMLEEWLPRIPDFRLNSHKPPVIRTGMGGSFASLHLIWD